MKKVVLLLGCLIISLSLLVSTTWTWQFSEDEAVNDFTLANLNAPLNDVFDTPAAGTLEDGTWSKVVTVQNVSDQPVFVRVMPFPQITRADGTATSAFSVDGMVNFDIILNDDWTNEPAEDGYYYYMVPLYPGETTTPLFETVTLDGLGDDIEYNGAKLDILVHGESCPILSLPGGGFAHYDAWWAGSAPDEDTSPELYKIENGTSATGDPDCLSEWVLELEGGG